jgi:acetyl-CoA carboxylase biotin carboxyl carrier protein
MKSNIVIPVYFHLFSLLLTYFHFYGPNSMSLTHEDVKRLLELLDASKFDELHLEADGTKLTLRRNGVGTTALPALSTTLSSSPTGAQNASTVAANPAPPVTASATDLIDVKASMLGQFYSAPKPGAPPFVVIGSKVQSQTAIAIIEVMKLMNSISAGVDGEVVEILVHDGDLVEFDQVLMRVRPN